MSKGHENTRSTRHEVGIGVRMPSTPPRTTLLLALAVIVLAVGGEWLLAAVYGENEVACRPASLPASLVDVPEASGVAASHLTANLLWTINDSGAPRLFALDENGDRKGAVTVAQARITDWEDVSISRCATGSCVYIGDIGDNDSHRSTVVLYRLPEPSPHEKTRQADRMEVRYPDGPRDAEAMFVLPGGQIYVISKESPAIVYRTTQFTPGTTATLERVMTLPFGHITDAEASADGRRVVMRTKEEAIFYRTDDLVHGDVGHGTVFPVMPLSEPQGEGITFGSGDSVFLIGEGGGKKAPGTFLRLECPVPGARP